MMLSQKSTRTLLLLLLLLLGATDMNAQNRKFSVASFGLDQFDLTARNDQYKKIDGNGSLYAIIKVTSTNPDDKLSEYRFNFGNMNHQVVQKDGELWVYVQRNAKMVTINRQGFTTINKYDLGTTIEEGKTYTMLLSSQALVVRHRILEFVIEPASKSTTIKIWREGSNDFELCPIDDEGKRAAMRLEEGIYRYEVSLEHYDTSTGRVNLQYNPSNHIETVKLTPKFGYLEVDNTYGIAGAQIYVDNKLVGKVPYTNKTAYDIGQHQIMISNGELYKPYTGVFTIRKGETTKLSPKLESNFAETTIIVANNAEIYINGEKKNNGKWVGPLKAAIYDVECRLPNHRSTQRQITVKPDISETFEMEAPKPITGSVYVTSNPLGASIQLDGKTVGTTPFEVPDVLIGRHTVRVLKDNYRAEETTVDVKEGQSAEASFQLRDFAKFTISCSPRATLRLNGEYKGSTPYSFEGASGEYDIELSAGKHYRPLHHSKVRLSSSHPNERFSLMRLYQLADCGYFQAGMQVGAMTGLGTTFGGYFSNINIEGYYIFGLAKSDDVYWDNNGGTGVPTVCTYKPMSFGLRTGYGFIVGSRVRITPQVGIGLVTIKCTDGDSKGSAIVGQAGLRLECAITPNLGLFATPSYSTTLSKTDVYKSLCDVSPKVKEWASGVNTFFGLYYSF